MSCDEGKRLSALFLQATLATRDLEAGTEQGDRRAQEIQSAEQFQEECRHNVTEHARTCMECNPTKAESPEYDLDGSDPLSEPGAA
jgi:hypothetical protein